jgi:hypothetical protein
MPLRRGRLTASGFKYIGGQGRLEKSEIVFNEVVAALAFLLGMVKRSHQPLYCLYKFRLTPRPVANEYVGGTILSPSVTLLSSCNRPTKSFLVILLHTLAK